MRCRVDGCGEESKHPLCLDHWKVEKRGGLKKCASCETLLDSEKPLCLSCYRASKNSGVAGSGGAGSRTAKLTATQIGESIGIKAHRVNRVLNELGWIEHDVEGWIATELGKKQGAHMKEHAQSGVPYVVWPEAVLSNLIFKRAVADFSTELQPPPPVDEAASGAQDAQGSSTTAPALQSHASSSESMRTIEARERFVPDYRAVDGHFVRSRAEMLIDNWLYENRVIHAFEKRVPIEEDILSDFYLPEGKVYIEYWGMEDDPKYAIRKAVKQSIYLREQIPLIELGDEHLRNLDDHLPRLLLKHKISVKMR